MVLMQDILNKLYELLDIEGEPVIHLEEDPEDGTWNAEIEPDGKLIVDSVDGYGDSIEEAIDDAVSRWVDQTPVIGDVPLRKLIGLLQYLSPPSVD
jgi:hypothetical protein